MSANETHARVARVLSGTYQAALAEQAGLDDDAQVEAFFLELGNPLEDIANSISFEEIGRKTFDIVLAQMTATTAIVRYFAANTDVPFDKAFPDLIRTYRKAGKNG